MLASYRRVLSVPGALAFSLTGLLARMPLSMVGLGIVLLITEASGSYGLAGSVAAVYILANAAMSVPHGRLVDQFGQSWVLPGAVTGFGIGLAGLIALVQTNATPALVYLTAAVAGAFFPQVGACVRARWSHVLSEPNAVQTAYALEGVADEVVFIAGPVLVTTISITVHPAAGLVAALLAGLCGTYAFAALRSTAPPGRRARVVAGGEPVSRMPWLVVAAVSAVFFALGSLFGSAEVATVAFADERDDKAIAGVLLGVWSFGSLLSGLAVGAVAWRTGPVMRVRWGALAMALTLLPMPWIDSVPAMAVVLFVAGFAVSPTLIGCASVIEQAAPGPRLSEALAFVHTGIAAGLAPGAALAGALIDRYGAAEAFGVSIGSGLVAVLIAWLTPIHRPAR
ncbi:MAG: MFS transporter [Nocardioides sp.]